MFLILNTLRNLMYLLCTSKHFYYVGMILVRFTRILRVSNYYLQKQDNEKYSVVNFMSSLKLKVNKYSYMGGSIYWSGFHHLNELLLLKNLSKPNMTFFDIGANLGEFTVFMAAQLCNGVVYSFEPLSANRKILEENIRINNLKNVKVFPFGLGYEDMIVPLYTNSESNVHHGINEGLSSVYKSETRAEFQENIELRNLDLLHLQGLNRMDIVKIDVEGSELSVLKGMRSHIIKFKPILMIEFNDDTFLSAGYNSNDLIKFISELGYNLYTFKRGEIIRKRIIQPSAWGNYIAVYEA